VKLPETGEITSFLFARKAWQIFQDEKGTRVLLTTPDLMDFWARRKFIDRESVRSIKDHGDLLYNYFLSPARYALSPVRNGDIPRDYSTAYTLAMALSSSRGLDRHSDFNTGIFSSLHRKILPVPAALDPPAENKSAAGPEKNHLTLSEIDDNHFKAELEERVDKFFTSARRADEQLLVNWLTKGAARRVSSQSRLSQLVRWLSSEQLTRVLRSAGITTAGGRLNSPAKDPPPPREAAEEKPEKIAAVLKSHEKTQSARRKERDPSRPLLFSLPGRRELEAFFNEHIVEVLNEPEKYKKMGIDNPSAVILHGPPGCGKTYAADKLVKFLDLPAFYVNSGTVASPYIHDSSKKISSIFDKAIAAAPSIIIIDEMEAYMGHRSSSGSQQHQVEEVAEFLRRIPEAIDRKVIIIAMTNLLEFIDAALLRQGRFDHKIKLDLPDKIDVRAALEFILEKRPAEDGLDVSSLVDILEKRPLSDCNYVVREASRLVVRRGREKLDLDILLEAAKRLPPVKMKPDIGF
jgi:hypothetical protein